jgi:hypothetical protein
MNNLADQIIGWLLVYLLVLTVAMATVVSGWGVYLMWSGN